MEIKGWKYYNHAAIPTTAPHEEPDLNPIKDGSVWKMDGSPLLARWTTDFDCGYETSWWYVIKDTPFDITKLKAKRRYEINKGRKYFDVIRLTKPSEYADQLYNVQVAAFSAYPEKYRPTVVKAAFVSTVCGWENERTYVYAAFDRENGRLCGYAHLTTQGRVIHFNVLKTDPAYEKYAINAALVANVLENFNDSLADGKYICDGARSINHETAFQDYLEKYFDFRKAYCCLHLTYNPKIKYLFKILFPVRKVFGKLDSVGLVHQLNSVIHMEEICRNEVARE